MKESSIQVRFWGVRGSIPAAKKETLKFGGNTPCVEVRCGKELLILDAGSGIRYLGNELIKKGKVKATILLSHLHWDHIQGFPFFTPAYLPGNHLQIYSQASHGLKLKKAFAGQMSSPYFPVRTSQLAAKITFHHFKMGQTLKIGKVKVSTFPAKHPQKCTAYRIDYGNRSILYATDTEHPKNGKPDPKLIKAARDINGLIYDATYTPLEYRGNGLKNTSKVGWGHSTWNDGVQLAKAANAKQLILFHHEPDRADSELLRIERQAKRHFAKTRAAREGMVLKF